MWQHINLELDIKKGIIGNLEREALENKTKMETIQGENMELKQRIAKESEQAKVDAKSSKTKRENLEQQLKQSESISQTISLGMHFQFRFNLYFTTLRSRYEKIILITKLVIATAGILLFRFRAGHSNTLSFLRQYICQNFAIFPIHFSNFGGENSLAFSTLAHAYDSWIG